MRRRLILTIVGLVTGALLLAGGGALLVASSTSRQHAVTQLLRQDQTFARTASSIRTPAVLRMVGRVLHLDRAAIVAIGPSGRVIETAPGNLAALHLPRMPTAPGPSSGVHAGVAYAVVPVRLDVPVTGTLPRGAWTAVLMTRRVGALLAGWEFFVAVAAATIVVALVAAAALGRRITRPLSAASEVTGRIAAGQLHARLPVADGHRDELDSLAGSINAMAASLEQARRRETELLASVSHDLRTPLTSIRGYAEAIADDVTDDPRRAARIITDQADRLERLVGDLLDLAKLRAERLTLHPAAVDVARSIDRAIDAVEPHALRLGVSLLPRSTSPNPVAYADPDRLAQVLANLIHNAVAHAASTVVVRAGTTGEESSPIVWATVEDDGPGIPPAQLEQVFDRFYQIDRGDAARAGGSGLGLSIVADLVSAMGGTVRAESPVSADPARPGSRFVVTLPGAPPTDDGLPHVGEPAASTGAQPRASGGGMAGSDSRSGPPRPPREA